MGSIYKNIEIEDQPGKTAEKFWDEFTITAVRVHGKVQGAVKKGVREALELYVAKYKETR